MPYAIILFDEIEKAHPDVFNILLQVLDEGHLTDGQGRKIDFRNTVIIMTSNIGSQYQLEGAPDAQEKINSLVKQSFKPELLNRIDEIITFNSLGFKVQVEITRKLLNELQSKLEAESIYITFGPDIQKYVMKNGFNEQFGARPLKRYIQRELETFIAKQIIQETILPQTKYIIEVENDNLSIHPVT